MLNTAFYVLKIVSSLLYVFYSFIMNVFFSNCSHITFSNALRCKDNFLCHDSHSIYLTVSLPAFIQPVIPLLSSKTLYPFSTSIPAAFLLRLPLRQ